MKVYVASSWRNTFQPEVVKVLRADGHDVYDFKDSEGFHWSEVDPEWQNWPSDIPKYLAGLNHPCAERGFERDMDALRGCEVCVYVMPCGPSASMEMGWAVGAGKRVVVYIPGVREPDLMVKMAHLVTDSIEQVRQFVAAPAPEPTRGDFPQHWPREIVDACQDAAQQAPEDRSFFARTIKYLSDEYLRLQSERAPEPRLGEQATGQGDAILNWWEGRTKCPHPETASGLAMDCLPCLRELVRAAHPGPSPEARIAELERLIRSMTFDKCPYCLGSTRNHHNPTCPVEAALSAPSQETP